MLFWLSSIFVRPTVSSYTAEMIAELLFDNVVRRGFIPEKIITERDPKITKSSSGKKDPVRTQASVGTMACVKPPWTAWEGWKRARSKQPACAHHPRWVSPASENAQMSTFQERAYGRRMASQEWQKSKPTCNEHS
jgi:hypothetical protein